MYRPTVGVFYYGGVSLSRAEIGWKWINSRDNQLTSLTGSALPNQRVIMKLIPAGRVCSLARRQTVFMTLVYSGPGVLSTLTSAALLRRTVLVSSTSEFRRIMMMKRRRSPTRPHDSWWKARLLLFAVADVSPNNRTKSYAYELSE